jgi:PAS domain S-box-containing protein
MLETFFSIDFMPHGHCYFWKPELVWLHFVANLLTTFAYYLVAAAIVYFTRGRTDLPVKTVTLLIGTFFVFVVCGTTHLLEGITIWYPVYWLEGTIKAINAGLSLYVFSFMLVPLIPIALDAPSPAQLEATNLALIQEISERKNIEQQLEVSLTTLQARNQELRDNENRLTQFLEAMPVGVFVVDAKGSPFYANRVAQQLLGNKPASTTTTFPWSEVYLAETGQAYPNEHHPLVRALTGEKARADNLEIHQADKIIPIEFWATPVFDEQGHITYAITAFQDITERLEREQSEKRAYEVIESVNNKIMQSIQYAKLIQSSLLPNLDSVKTFLPKSFCLWQPRDVVGGDMLYLEQFEKDVLVAVLDCTGHSVPGALMTMVATTQLRRIIQGEGCHQPADILQRLNWLVKNSLQQDTEHARSDDGLDAAICLVKPQEQQLLFAGAKLPLYYLHQDQIKMIKGDKQNLGYKRSDVNFNFTTHTLSLENGMIFYLATDGFIDQLGGTKRLPLGNKRFQAWLLEHRQKPVAEQDVPLLKAFQEYQGENERQDDVTVVGFGVDLELT